MKKTLYQITIIMVACMFLIACQAAAVRPSQAKYDNGMITSTIDAFCIGTFTIDHEMQWTQTSDDRGLSFSNNPIAPGETRVDYTYRENTLGYDGTATYLKDFSMNGENTQAGLDNLNINHIIEFENNPNSNGVLRFEEMARLDIAGAAGADANNPICIFAAPSGSADGSFKGSVTVGSLMNVREVSAMMGIGSSAISDDPNAPVNLRYSFDAEGLATDPKDNLAVGSATVYSNVDMHLNNSYHPDLTAANEACVNDAKKENEDCNNAATTAQEGAVCKANLESALKECDALLYSSPAPGMVGHIQDQQSQTYRGLFDIATTFGAEF